MSSLLEMREKLREIYGKYEVYLTPLFKFLLALVMLLCINGTIGYMDKLQQGLSVIGPDDTTVLLGDLSWALDLPSSRADFAWINDIPGRKIILKGKPIHTE